MEYVYVDTDGSTNPTNATPDNSADSKYFTTDVGWAGTTDGSRWNTLAAAVGDTTIQGRTGDLTIYCRGTTADIRAVLSSLTCATLTLIGEVTEAKWNTAKYKIVNANGAFEHALLYSGANIPGAITLRGLQVEGNTNNGTTYVVNIVPNTGTTNTMDSCIIRTGATSRTNDSLAVGFYPGYNANTFTWNIYNTIIYAIGGATTSGSYGIRCNGDVGITLNVYNCVIADITRTSGTCNGIGAAGSDTVTIKNCAVFNTGGGDDIANADTISYCATDDETGTGCLNPADWTTVFESHATGDFRLKSGSALIGAGTDNPGSGLYSDDIVGTARSSVWDIGAFEYVSGTSTPYVALQTQRNIRGVFR